MIPQGVRSDRQACRWPHFFCVSNLPTEIVEEWTKFKDLVRYILPRNQPGWTDTWPSKNAGVFSVKTEDDAQTAYRALTENKVHNHDLLVHYFDVSSQSPAKLLKCNCSEFYGTDGHCERQSFAMDQLEHWTRDQHHQTYSPVSPQQYVTNMYPTPVYPANALFGHMASMPQLTGYYDNASSIAAHPVSSSYGSFGYQHPDQTSSAVVPSTVSPLYARNDNGLPVNAAHGAIQSEHRTVVITGLRSQISLSDLEKLLTKAGLPVHYELRSSGSSNQPKASAVAYFATAEEARHAVRVLNGRPYSGVKLRAWPGKDLTPVETPPRPMVVNGSTGYQVNAKLYCLEAGETLSVPRTPWQRC